MRRACRRADPSHERIRTFRSAAGPIHRGDRHLPAAPAGRVSHARCPGRAAVCRQSPRSAQTRVVLLPEVRRARPPGAVDGGPDRRHRDHGHALRERGTAAREQPHQGARAALQHPVPRRQVVSVSGDHRPPVSAPGFPSRCARQGQPVLRAVSACERGARKHPAPAEGVSPPHLRGHRFRQPVTPVSAAPDPSLHGAVRGSRDRCRIR